MPEENGHREVVAVSGSTGLVGSALIERLKSSGYAVRRLVRPGSSSQLRQIVQGAEHETTIEWDPGSGLRHPGELNGVRGVIHLAGKGIASGRWSEGEKQQIRRSRVEATSRLVDQILELEKPPRAFVSASALGYYGDHGDHWVDEQTPPANDFLGRVAHDWESMCAPLNERGVRVAYPRLGMVLSKQGGALQKILPLFRWMLGGRLGSGSQYWSWVSLHDCVRAVHWMFEFDEAVGPFNVASPDPVTNAEFTRCLARAVGRPACLPAPKFGLRLAMGEMADALLLTSCRATPKRLQEFAFEFRDTDLQSFLRNELG